MATSQVVEAIDWVQAELRPLFKLQDFKSRGRTFNRLTSDGLTQVINFQTGPFDPPGMTYIPGLRGSMYGLFTVNLGVYIPEVATRTNMPAKSWVQEYSCSIRQRLGSVSGEATDIWWRAAKDDGIVEDLRTSLINFGFPFLERFATRDDVLAEFEGQSPSLPWCPVPRIVSAIILAERNEPESARLLLAAQAAEAHNPGHPEFVRKLAERMGLGMLR